MPAAAIAIGVEFVFARLSNGDDTLLQSWVTVTTGTPALPGRFTIRWVNGSATAAALTLKPSGQTPINVVLNAGPGTFNAGTRLWSTWRTVEIMSVARPQ